MAFLNNKYTAFNPSVSISGAETPIYYDLSTKFPYTAEFVVKGDYGNKYWRIEEVEHLIFDGADSRIFQIALFNYDKFQEISFVNESLASWDEYPILSLASGSKVKRVNFVSVGEGWNFDTYIELFEYEYLEEINVFEGWNFDLACWSEYLTNESKIGIIENLATVTDEHFLDIGVDGLPSEYIQMAVNKGWTVS